MEDLLLDQFADELLTVINNSGWSTLDQIKGKQDEIVKQILSKWYRTDEGVILLNEAIKDFNLFKVRYPTHGWGRSGGLVWRNDIIPFHQNPDYHIHVNGTDADLIKVKGINGHRQSNKRKSNKRQSHKRQSNKKSNKKSNKRKHSKKRK
jgi:hypothetical protein